MTEGQNEETDGVTLYAPPPPISGLGIKIAKFTSFIMKYFKGLKISNINASLRLKF